MRNRRSLIPLALALCAGAALMYGYSHLARLLTWSRTGSDIHSALGSEILVMRTAGGLLEVSRLRANEQFDTRFVYSVLGVKVGETIPHIRVPAVYRYHIELAPEWTVIRTGEVFTVITPPVRPSLPVAVDLTHMEKDVGGTWILVPLNQEDDLNALERQITAVLVQKAESPVYLQLQRDAARKTVTEFVKKWLVTQEPWKAAKQPTIEVVFRD